MTELTTEQCERIKDFVKALRSGEYQQNKGRLRLNLTDDDTGLPTGKVGYCCEGVAAERYARQLGYTVTVDENDGDLNISYAEDGDEAFSSWTVAPPRFWREMGMLTDERLYNGLVFVLPDDLKMRGQQIGWEEYASLNDDGLTFDQIADLIEWQFLGSAA